MVTRSPVSFPVPFGSYLLLASFGRGGRGEGDASCDQFAAAVLAYELLVHDRFYGALKPHEIWQEVCGNTPGST